MVTITESLGSATANVSITTGPFSLGNVSITFATDYTQSAVVNYPTFKQMANTFSNIQSMLIWTNSGHTGGVALCNPLLLYFNDANTSIANVQSDFSSAVNIGDQPSITVSGNRLFITANTISANAWTDFTTLVGAFSDLKNVVWYDGGGGVGQIYAFFGDQNDRIVHSTAVSNSVITTLWPSAIQFSNTFTFS